MEARHKNGGQRSAGPRAGSHNPSLFLSAAMQALEVTNGKGARFRAKRVLKLARQRDCCRSLLEHLLDRVGSTPLLQTSDPGSASGAFPMEESA
jgi:hypothetical protein